MTVLLTTSRLVLRAFTAADADRLVDLDADPDVMFYITGGAPTPREEIVSEVLPAFLAYDATGTRWGFWAVEKRDTGEFLGWFHLRPAAGRPDDEPELGYRLRKAFWGKGYATEGAVALVQYAFAECGAACVVAEAMAVHGASRRVMEKAGLRPVRTFHADWPVPIPGDEHGDVEYVITRQEWAAATCGCDSLAALPSSCSRVSSPLRSRPCSEHAGKPVTKKHDHE